MASTSPRAPSPRTMWRIIRWSLAAALLLLPAVAMRLGDEVHWTGFDFVVMATMLALALGGYEVLTTRASTAAHGMAAAVGMLAAFLLVWINLAVGIIGSEQNPANLMYAAVLGVAVLGLALSRLRPAGMARAMVATAVAQTLVAGVALAAGLGSDGPIWPGDVIGVTGLLDLLWLAAAWLFARGGTHRVSAHGEARGDRLHGRA